MSTNIHDDQTRLTDLDQLVDYIAAGGKPREKWVVGTEHEKIGWWPKRGAYPDYFDPAGIGPLLEAMARDGGWEVTREAGAIIALARDGATVTLEPGGQLELSGAPLRTLAETEGELDAHFAEIQKYSAPLGIEWSGLGLAPIGPPTAMPKMPKQRYDRLCAHLMTHGKMGLHMMRQTCTVQANLDFADETDAFRKLRLALYVQPFVLAAFANSPVVEGRLVPEKTFRGRIWEDTDPDRWRFPPSFLAPGGRFIDYVNWAVDVPMPFLRREGQYLDCGGLTFRTFMAQGFGDYYARLGDFAVHLSALFPDVRLKQYLEVRAADMGDRDHVLALPAFTTGLLYDEAALNAGLALFDAVTYDDWWTLRHAVPTEGLDARLRGRPLSAWGVELLKLARAGLNRREPGATHLLDVLDRDVPEGRSPADRLREIYTGDPAALLAATRIA
ncbi:MAG: glutamate--cysteine ligase [Myxococcales bacterium]|nr:glutamate--cysteine ligase [Myxococcales bacterium]